MSKTKAKSTANIERLRATQEAVKLDLGRFNQGLWVSAPNSAKFPETCGGFSWFAGQLYGTTEQKKKFTWDKAHMWVGKQILGLTTRESESLFWGGNTIEMIETIIDKMEATQ